MDGRCRDSGSPGSARPGVARQAIHGSAAASADRPPAIEPGTWSLRASTASAGTHALRGGGSSGVKNRGVPTTARTALDPELPVTDAGSRHSRAVERTLTATDHPVESSYLS